MGNTLFSPTAARLVTLIGSTLVTLASGTSYVLNFLILTLIPFIYSIIKAYEPQLTARVGINHTQSNLVVMAGNVGVLSGPLWGRLVDKRGPRILFASGFVLLFVGYSAIRYFYLYASAPISTFAFLVLTLCSMLTGVGSMAGIIGAMNTNAKSWPDSKLATTNGIVASGMGLSAFAFSTVATFFFHGNTSSLLLLLSFGTSIPMILGFFIVKPVPPTERDDSHESDIHSEPTGVLYRALPVDDSGYLTTANGDEEQRQNGGQTRDNCRTRLYSRDREFSASSSQYSLRHDGPGQLGGFGSNVDLHGLEIIKTLDFWLLFIQMLLLTGTGLMYINNVGSMVQALLAHDNSNYDPAEGLKAQGIQVSNISMFNFFGRVVIGIIADMFKHRFGFPRSFAMMIVASGFVISQLIAYHVEDIQHLWKASVILGGVYGMFYGLYPTIVIDWLGMSHFSENWGFVSMAPAIGGNIFSVLFGRVLDAHNPHRAKSRSGVNTFSDASRQCSEGRMCYIDALRLTTLACTIALCMSIYASWKDWRRLKAVSSN